ncbi:MAG TPA: hypothetical protein VGX21_13435 [Methylomirabilota bacterium]|nr:hypothetical protein [Methylomirabilota bacterium]
MAKRSRLAAPLCALLAAILAGCVSTPTWDAKDLAAVLDAYRKQNVLLEERRQARERQMFRKLAVSKGPSLFASTVSVDLERAPLEPVVRRVLDDGDLPYSIEAPLPAARVTARFDALPVLPALNRLLEPHGLSAAVKDSVLVIGPGGPGETAASAAPAPPATPAPPSPPAAAAPPAPPGAPILPGLLPGLAPPGLGAPRPWTGITVPLRYLDTAAAAAFLDGLYPLSQPAGTRVITFGQQPYTNAISLVGGIDEVGKAARLLRQADHEPAHVVIEALVVEFDADALEQLGTDLQNFASGEISALTTAIGLVGQKALTFTYTAGAANRRAFTALIDVMVQHEKARLISRPFLATLSGKSAAINITRDRYVIVQSAQFGATVVTPNGISAGIIMNITPTVLPEGMVRLDVSVQDSLFVPSVSPNIAAEVDKNQANTAMLVESGQSIIIAGLTLNRQTTSNAGLPWLRHVPLLNLLAAKQQAETTRAEVMVFVTPHVWSPGMTSPLAEPDAFSFRKDDRDLTDLERFRRP